MNTFKQADALFMALVGGISPIAMQTYQQALSDLRDAERDGNPDKINDARSDVHLAEMAL